jgi:hypothetical protein
MNPYIEKSIKLAKADYLDKLNAIYPVTIENRPRTINERLWNDILEALKGSDDAKLIRAMIRLEKFPIKNGYASFFRMNPDMIDRNPNMVKKLADKIRSMGIDEIRRKVTEPAETNRQMGQMFRQWVESGALGLKPCDRNTFEATRDDAILKGSDKVLAQFAKDRLNFERERKGLDFVARIRNIYVIGEAKFVSTGDGNQNNQVSTALDLLSSRANANKIVILDGTCWIESDEKIHTMIVKMHPNETVMSALLLKEYLENL